MTFGELRDDFKMKLNRRDITASQVDTYIKGAIQRTQRLLRVSAAEKAQVVTVGPDFQRLPIPGDYLKGVSITYHGLNLYNELRRTDLTTALKHSIYPGHPQWFARDGAQWVIGPKPQEGTTLTVVYHADFTDLSADTDANWLTQIAPDIIVNGALSAALRTYVDPRRDSYEADYLQAITDLNLQSSDDELTNAVMRPIHNGEDW